MILPPTTDLAVGGFLCEKTEKPDQWVSLHLLAVLNHNILVSISSCEAQLSATSISSTAISSDPVSSASA